VIIESAGLREPARLHLEESLMPEKVQAEVVGMRPSAAIPEPGDAFVGPPRHLEHVGNRMPLPNVPRGELDGQTSNAFRLSIETPFFQRESQTSLREPRVRVAGAKRRHNALQYGQHRQLVAKHEAQHVGKFDGQHVLRIGNKNVFKNDRGSSRRIHYPLLKSLQEFVFAIAYRAGGFGAQRVIHANDGGRDHIGARQGQQQKAVYCVREREVRIGCDRAGKAVRRRSIMSQHRFHSFIPRLAYLVACHCNRISR
jgi:hypothetical protein